MDQLSAVESAVKLKIFTHTSLIFRLVRRILEVHLIYQIPKDIAFGIKVPGTYREDTHILEGYWLLLFLSASPSGILNCLKYHHEIMPSLATPSLYVVRNRSNDMCLMHSLLHQRPIKHVTELFRKAPRCTDITLCENWSVHYKLKKRHGVYCESNFFD